jgi:ATP-dependent DNA helicase 2 subunit 1
MGDGASATENGTASQQTGQPGSASFPVNVSAAEAARRREAATIMLSNAGVDPTTLSADQFGIFANQAPELQRESLNMLVKYGAERLRIVHPDNREGSAQASASSQSSQTTSSGPRTTKELVPQPSAQSNANADTAASQAADDSTSKRKTKKMGKSRTACFACKARKTKVSIQKHYSLVQS